MTPNLDQERVERAAEIVAGALKQRDVMGYHNAAEILARAAITAYQGDTHVVVPKEPNYEMGEAGIASLGADDARHAAQTVADVYRAMLSATPAGKER